MAAASQTTKKTSRALGAPRIGRLRAFVAMARPSQIALILVILANGALLGSRTEGSMPPLETLVLGVILAVLAAVAVHLANEAADDATDRLTERTPFSGGSGALEASGMDPRAPLLAGLLLAGIAALMTAIAVAAAVVPPVAGLLLLLGLGGGLAYSLWPVAAMRRGWGEPLNAVLGGSLLPLFGVALVAGAIAPRDILAFLPFLFVVFASVMATAWPDRAADAATGKLTMQVRLRPHRLRRIHATASLAFVAATVLSAASEAMPFVLASLLVVPALLLGMRGYTRTSSPLPNVIAMVGLALITAAALALDVATGTTA